MNVHSRRPDRSRKVSRHPQQDHNPELKAIEANDGTAQP